jgi:MFS family permease
MDESPFGEAPEQTAAVIAALQEEKQDNFPRAVRALRHLNFRLFWTGNFLSNIGTWMQNVAQGWLVITLTNSSFWLGVVGFAGSIPFLMFTLFGGVFADRVNKRRLLVVTQTAMMLLAFLLAALTYFKIISVWSVAAIAFANGVALAMNAPSYQALVPRLVPREDLTNAIALNSAQFNMSRILGPTLGGYAMLLLGIAGNFFLNGLSFVAVLWALLKMRFPEEPAVRHESVLRSLRSGFVYLNGHPQMRVMMAMTAVVSLLAMPFITFIPYFAKIQLGAGETGLGWLLACSGTGSVLGALTIAVLGNIRRRGPVLTLTGIVFFLAIAGFSESRHMLLSEVLAFIEGFNGILMISCFNVSLQHLSSDEMRGRIMSIYATSFLGLPPLGSLMAGELSRHIAAAHVLALMAALATLMFIAVFAGSRPLRELD